MKKQIKIEESVAPMDQSMSEAGEMRIQFHDEVVRGARIKVVGVGGGGSNAVNRMIQARMEGVEFVAANTDVQALKLSEASVKLQLGVRLTSGLGAGSNPDVGRRAALEDSEKIIEALEGADIGSSSPRVSVEARAPAPRRSSLRWPARWASSQSPLSPSRSRSRERRVAMHLALDLELRRARAQQRQRLAHLGAPGAAELPKFECDSSATLGSSRSAAPPRRRAASISAICSAVGSSIDIGVAEEEGALGQDQREQRRRRADARPSGR